MASPPLQWIWHVGPQVDRMTGCWGIPWTSKSIFGGVFSTRLLRNPNYMWRIQQLQPVHEHRFTTGVPSKVKLIHCRAWKQPFPKWRMVEATTNILFHPGGDYICASFARNVFSKQDDEWWICVNDSRPCCGTWRMESWCPYCKCLKQRWPVTALSWKQKDIQRLQTSNRYTITKQGVIPNKFSLSWYTVPFFVQGTYISVHEAIFWNVQVRNMSQNIPYFKHINLIQGPTKNLLELVLLPFSACLLKAGYRAMQAGTFGWGGVVMVDCFWTYFF